MVEQCLQGSFERGSRKTKLRSDNKKQQRSAVIPPPGLLGPMKYFGPKSRREKWSLKYNNGPNGGI